MPWCGHLEVTRHNGTVPAIPRCMWKDRLQESLQRLSEQDPIGLDGSASASWRATLLQARRYSRIFVLQPEEAVAREVLQQRLESDAVVLKLYHVVQAKRRQQEFDDLETVQRLCGLHLKKTVVRPLTVYADLGAVMTVRAVGQPAAPLMQRACRRRASAEQMAESAALCTRAGMWLAAFQQAQPPLLDRCSPHLATGEDFVGYVETRLRHMQQQPFRLSEALLTRTLQVLRQALEDEEVLRPTTWSHSDFGPHNLLGDATHLTVLDFELMPQHPWFDAAYFVESLAGYQGPRYRSTSVDRLQRVFLSGYGLTGTETLFLALRIRHLVCTAASLRAQRTLLPMRNWPDHWMLQNRLARLVRQLEMAHTGQSAPVQMA